MKGFGIYVKNDLLEAKHVANMEASVWLYLWLLDKMTSINENGVGRILGNQPVTYSQIYIELGISKRTYTRWVARLRKHGYINTTRTPHGLVFSVTKATKLFKRSAKSGVSEQKVIRHKVHSDTPNVAPRYAKLAHLNKDKTITIQDNTMAPAKKLQKNKTQSRSRKTNGKIESGYQIARRKADELKRRQGLS